MAGVLWSAVLIVISSMSRHEEMLRDKTLLKSVMV